MSDFAHTILSLERGTIDCNGFQMISIANNCNITFYYPFFLWFILYYTILWSMSAVVLTCTYIMHTQVTRVTQVTHRCTVSIWFLLYVISIQFLYVSIYFYIVSVPIWSNLYLCSGVMRCWGSGKGSREMALCWSHAPGDLTATNSNRIQYLSYLVLSCPTRSTRKKKGLRYVSYISLY